MSPETLQSSATGTENIEPKSLPDQTEQTCYYCKQLIPTTAKVCHHCGRYQRRFVNHLSSIPIAISIVLIVLAFLQWAETRANRIASENNLKETAEIKKKTVEAFEKAETAKQETTTALQEAQSAKKDIEMTAKDLKEVVRGVVENSWILGSSSFLAMGGERPAAKRLEKNLNKMVEFVEPNKKAQDEWFDSLHNLFPDRQKKDSGKTERKNN